jgi:predicted secreted protein
MKTIRILLLISLSINFILVFSQNAPSDNSLNKKLIKVSVNKRFDLKFNSTPSAGYSWQVEKIDSVKIKLISKTEKLTGSQKQVGGPVIEIWSFIGLVKGSYNLKFIYKRSWESEIIKTEEIKVVIK